MTRVRQNVYYKLTGKILRTSEKAVHFQMATLQGMEISSVAWWPRSQIENMILGGAGEEDSFEASDWILSQKGFGPDLARCTEGAQRVVTERFPDSPEDDEPPRLADRRTLPKGFDSYDDMDDDIPF